MRNFLIMVVAFAVIFSAFFYLVGQRGGWLATDVIVLSLVLAAAGSLGTRLRGRAK